MTPVATLIRPWVEGPAIKSFRDSRQPQTGYLREALDPAAAE